MARKRMVHPEFFTSESLSGEDVAVRLTFIGLLIYCDDYGYGKDNPSLVKATVWPLDDLVGSDTVGFYLDRLVAVGSLCRFACCGKPQFHLPSWTEWQKVSHPTATKCCPCPTHYPGASGIHCESLANGSGTFPPSVVEVSSGQFSSGERPPNQRSPEPPCPHVGESATAACFACRSAVRSA